MCGKPVELRNLAFLRGNTVVCSECFPEYYVRNLCRVVAKRARGEQPLACQVCRFRKVCDRYIRQVEAATRQ